MCNIRIDGASGVCDGEDFRGSVSTKRPKHGTDLPVRPKATEN